jgi:phosphatidylserine decarboxylase
MSVVASIRSQLAPINREGYPFVGAFALVSLILFWIWTPLGWIGTVLTLWCVYFFRDPVRVTPVREGIVVAPADGRVSKIINAVPPVELGLGDRPLPRVSIFMSVFDCHVNRSPVSGRIEKIVYKKGAFLRHYIGQRPHRCHPDRRLGGAAHCLLDAPGRKRGGRRTHRHDPVRIAS